MRFSHLILVFGLLLSCNSKEKKNTSYLSSQDMVMSAPILECDNLFFTDSVAITMNFSLPDSSIKYTLDDSEVDTQSKTYIKPISLKETTTIRAKNFHPEFHSGASTTLKVIRTNTKLVGSTVTITPSPNERYRGNGNSSLTDRKKGTTSFASGNEWLGFQADSVEVDIDFPASQSISKVTVSTLSNHGAWIFLPESIVVFSRTQKVGAIEVQPLSEDDTSRLEFIEIPIKEDSYDNLKIVVRSLKEIPEWHQGKGTLPWLFTDEILVE